MEISNIPKFINRDYDLFKGIIKDLFPRVVIQPQNMNDINNAIVKVIDKENYDCNSDFL